MKTQFMLTSIAPTCFSQEKYVYKTIADHTVVTEKLAHNWAVYVVSLRYAQGVYEYTGTLFCVHKSHIALLYRPT